MFTLQELTVIHRSVSELTIKGAESPGIAALLAKITNHHSKLQNPTPKQSALSKKGK